MIGRCWIGVGIVMTLALASCAKRPIVVGPSQNLAAIKARFGHKVLHWVIERSVAGEEVTCGYVANLNVIGIAAGPFIAREGQVFTQQDLPQGQFDRWEDILCGPDWVKPLDLGIPPVASRSFSGPTK